MEQNSQNNNYSYPAYGYVDPMLGGNGNINNMATNATGSPQNDNFSYANTASPMNSSMNGSALLNDNDGGSEFDNDGLGSNLMDNNGSNMGSHSGTPTGPQRVRARGMQGAHAVGPTRSAPTRSIATQHPYARPQPSTVQSQAQARAQRHQARQGTAAGDMATQNATNAYTLPRSRPSAVQPQAQRDMSYDAMPGLGQAAPSARSDSLSSFDLTDLNGEDPGADGTTPDPDSTPFTAPVHHKLDSTRIDPAGLEKHPDPDWRAPSPHQWTEILYNHTLLQYLTDSAIKDLQKHCGMLSRSAEVNPVNPNGPKIVQGGRGRFTVLDAQAVWDYCSCYIKRRNQLKNNSAAYRTRANKKAELKHWKALALAAGAPDRRFKCNFNDPANIQEAPETLLSAVTQVSMTEMKKKWASATGGGAHAAFPSLPPPGFVAGQARQPQNWNQAQQQIYSQPQIITSGPQAGYSATMLASLVPQGSAADMSAYGPSAYNAAPPPPTMTAPLASTASAATDIHQPSDTSEEFKLDMNSADAQELLEHLEHLNNTVADENSYLDEFDYGGTGV